jgi:regulator of protease activity HflC (stomatin/prohibitin superfamily)
MSTAKGTKGTSTEPELGDLFDLSPSSVVWKVVLFIGFAFFYSGFHNVQEGHTAVYYKWGELLNTTGESGMNWRFPIATSSHEVSFTVQTDSVENVPCGTASGVLINFAKIEVVNRLNKHLLLDTIRNYTVNYDKTWIYDKIHHEVNQFCSKHTLQEVYITRFEQLDDRLAEQLRIDLGTWAPGIEIISVRVTKPVVPTHILQKFEQVEAEATNLQIASKQQMVEKVSSETKQIQATMMAQQESSVAGIQNQQAIDKKQAELAIQEIENKKAQTVADTKLYESEQLAKGNDILLTDRYLKLKEIEALGSIQRIYYGEKVPTTSINMGSDPNIASGH